jgi:phage N-6-adenine-methyltransferase
MSKDTDERTTPQDFFDKLDSIFHFDCDAAATASNAKCSVYFDIASDGLTQDWGQFNSIFVNPPYSRGQLIKWITKAASTAKRSVIILPCDLSTEAGQLVLKTATYLYFVAGRLKFNGNDNGAKSGTIIAVFGPTVSNFDVAQIYNLIDGRGVDLK